MFNLGAKGAAMLNMVGSAATAGRAAGGLFAGKYGATAAGAAWGGAAGATMGAMSNNTSILGGMAAGAGLGAAGGRYGMSGAKVFGNAMRGNMGAGFGMRQAGRYVGGMMRRDIGAVRNWGATLASNAGNRIGSTLKGWGKSA